MHILNLFFSFHGRINRAQYWLGNLGASFLGSIAIFFLAFIVAPHPGVKPDPMAQAALTMGAFLPVLLAMAWAGLAIQVKRFHDRGRSGYFAIAPFVPCFMIVSAVMEGIFTNAAADLVVPKILPWIGVSGLINLFLFVDLGLMPGKQDGNKYGDPPGAGAPSAQFAPKGGAPTPSTLDSAATALDRAIAQQKAPKFADAAAGAPRPAVATRAPVAGQPATPASFGRRTAR